MNLWSRTVRFFPPHEAVLLLVIVVEVILFQIMGRNFLTDGNVSNVFRHSVEIGLLALAMTPVILTGGIDLSVGSLMGLCAVLFGIMVNILGLNPWTAGALTILCGAVGGCVNAGLVAGLKLPPLIVTLGTFSLSGVLPRRSRKVRSHILDFPKISWRLGIRI